MGVFCIAIGKVTFICIRKTTVTWLYSKFWVQVYYVHSLSKRLYYNIKITSYTLITLCMKVTNTINNPFISTTFWHSYNSYMDNLRHSYPLHNTKLEPTALNACSHMSLLSHWLCTYTVYLPVQLTIGRMYYVWYTNLHCTNQLWCY